MQLKGIFEKNGYDNKFFDRCLRTFLNKIYSKKLSQYTVPKKMFIFSFLISENCRFQQDKLKKKLSVTFFLVSF